MPRKECEQTEKECRILVLSPYYMSFAKGLTDAISSWVEKIDVLIYHNWLMELSNYLPKIKIIQKARHYTIDSLIESGKRPPNVNLHINHGIAGLFKRNSLFFAEELSKIFLRLIREKQIEFDIIHSHFIWPFGYIGNKISREYGVPHVITAHGYDIYRLPFLNNRWKNRIIEVLNLADFITTVSQANVSLLEELKIRTPFTIIPNGYDGSIFFPRNRADCRKIVGIDSNMKMILTIGSLEPVKGHTRLISAIGELSKKRDDVICMIIGKGTLEKKIRKQIKNLGLEHQIKLVGWRPHPEIPYWIGACDVFALSSLSEGNPSVVFESLACGRPVVATAVGGIPQVIVDERYGYLCHTGSIGEICEKLMMALEKNYDFQTISNHAKEFSYNEIAKKYLYVFQKIMNVQ